MPAGKNMTTRRKAATTRKKIGSAKRGRAASAKRANKTGVAKASGANALLLKEIRSVKTEMRAGFRKLGHSVTTPAT